MFVLSTNTVWTRRSWAKGAWVDATDGLVPILHAAFKAGGVHLVVAKIDYSENKRVLIDELKARSLRSFCCGLLARCHERARGNSSMWGTQLRSPKDCATDCAWRQIKSP
jgi:hypothetical protein